MGQMTSEMEDGVPLCGVSVGWNDMYNEGLPRTCHCAGLRQQLQRSTSASSEMAIVQEVCVHLFNSQ